MSRIEEQFQSCVGIEEKVRIFRAAYQDQKYVILESGLCHRPGSEFAETLIPNISRDWYRDEHIQLQVGDMR